MPNQPLTQPLTETTFFILLSLAQKSGHGYAIMQDVRALSKGRVILSTGTLYTALKRLLEQNWIERMDEGAADKTGRKRKAYRLTKTGQAILNVEISRLETLVGAVRSRSLKGTTP